MFYGPQVWETLTYSILVSEISPVRRHKDEHLLEEGLHAGTVTTTTRHINNLNRLHNKLVRNDTEISYKDILIRNKKISR